MRLLSSSTFFLIFFLSFLASCGVIPFSVVYTGGESFRSNPFITDAIVADGVTTVAAAAFADCSSLRSVHFPPSLDSIEDNAFSGCALAEVTIPANVTRLGAHAFTGNAPLARVRLDATDPPTLLGNFVFSGCSSALQILVPSGSVDAYIASWSPYSSAIISQ